jgi:adenine/guanine/hypoxanthine permease
MIPSVLAALGMTADGVAEGLYAIRHGFSARVAAVGFAIGAVIVWFANAATPLTFTVESIAVATRTVKERPLIFYVVALSAIPSIILGLTGLYSQLIELLDPSVIAGTIGGVGIILTGVGVDYLKQRPLVAGGSTLVGFAAYLLTEDLVLVIIAGAGTGTALHHLLPDRFQKLGTGAGDDDEAADEGSEKDETDGEDGEDEEDGGDESSRKGSFRPIPFEWGRIMSRPVLVGAFAVFALRTGAVVSYDTVNANLAGQDPTLDSVTFMAGVGSLASSVLGGPPLETTPAPMAATPEPVLSTALYMALMAGVCALALVRRVGTFVPLQAIAGFLIVLGIPVIMPEQLPTALESPIPGGTALAITALSNPFYGIVAGELVAIVIELAGGLAG